MILSREVSRECALSLCISIYTYTYKHAYRLTYRIFIIFLSTQTWACILPDCILLITLVFILYLQHRDHRPSLHTPLYHRAFPTHRYVQVRVFPYDASTRALDSIFNYPTLLPLACIFLWGANDLLLEAANCVLHLSCVLQSYIPPIIEQHFNIP